MAFMMLCSMEISQLRVQINKVCPIKNNSELFEFIRHAVEQEINRMQQEEPK